MLPDAEAQERFDLELALGESMRAGAINTDVVNGYFLALAERAEESGQPVWFAHAVLGFVGQRAVRFTPSSLPVGSDARAIALVKRALDGVSQKDKELQVLLSCSLVHLRGNDTDGAEREASMSQALRFARASDKPWLMVRALWMQLYYCARPGRYDERLALCEELIETSARANLAVDEIARSRDPRAPRAAPGPRARGTAGPGPSALPCGTNGRKARAGSE